MNTPLPAELQRALPELRALLGMVSAEEYLAEVDAQPHENRHEADVVAELGAIRKSFVEQQ